MKRTKCKGENCDSVDGLGHSLECVAEHERTYMDEGADEEIFHGTREALNKLSVLKSNNSYKDLAVQQTDRINNLEAQVNALQELITECTNDGELDGSLLTSYIEFYISKTR